MMKAKQAAGEAGVSPTQRGRAARRNLPSDMIRGKASKSTAALPSTGKADKPILTKAVGGSSKKPEPVPKTVDDIDAEVAAVEKLLTENYGYSNELAGDAAKRTREFLQTEEQAAAEVARKAEAEKQPTAEKKDAGTGKAAGGGAAKSASPLDMIRKGGSAAKKGDSADKPAAKSPLELMKAKAGGGKSGGEAKKPAAPKPPAPKKAAVKREVLRTAELRDFYLQTVRPYLASSGRDGRLADSTESSRAFTQMRATLPVELHETLESLQQYCEELRQFSEQRRLHRWLHYWLALHIPFSIGLFVLFVFHVVMSLRVVPWNFPFKL